MIKAQLNNTIFMLCDLQEKFRPAIHGFPSIVKVAQRMIESSKLLKIPLVVTEQSPAKLGKTVEDLDVKEASFFTTKSKFSMMTRELQKYMDSLYDRKCVVIFGIEAHICIMQTVMDLLHTGYDVTVLADGTSSRHPHDAKLAFEQMKAWGASIITSEALLFRLMKTAEHENFRAISTMVKDYIPYIH